MRSRRPAARSPATFPPAARSRSPSTRASRSRWRTRGTRSARGSPSSRSDGCCRSRSPPAAGACSGPGNGGRHEPVRADGAAGLRCVIAGEAGCAASRRRSCRPLRHGQAQRARGPAGGAGTPAVRRSHGSTRTRASGDANVAGGAAARRDPDDGGRPVTRGSAGGGRGPRPRPAGALPARRGRLGDHGQWPRSDLRRAVGTPVPDEGGLHRRSPPAPDHRKDRRPGGPPGGRGQPDVGRPAARRQPGQRGRATDSAGRLAAHDPQVCRRSVHGRRSHLVRHLDRAGVRVAGGVRARPAEHRDQRGDGLRQDDHAERALLVHSRRRADRHDRGRGGTATASGSRAAAGIAAGQPGRPRPDHDPRSGPQLAADATRPDHHRRGPRRRRPGRAAGHEHWPRWLHHHRARQFTARLPVPTRDDGADVGHRTATAGDPRADGLGGRPDHPPGPAEGRDAADNPRDRGRRDGGARDHAAGCVSFRLPGRGGPRRPVPGHAAAHGVAPPVRRRPGRPRRLDARRFLRTTGAQAMTQPWPRPPRAGPARATGLEAGALAACVALAVAALLLAMEAGTSSHAGARPGRSPAPRPVIRSQPAVIDLHRSLALIGVLATVFAALTLIGLLLASSLLRDRRGRRLAERIASYTMPGPAAGAEADGTPAGMAVGWVARLLRSGRTEKRLAERLDLAGISRKPAEWVLLGTMAGLLLTVVLTMLTGSPVIGVLGGALLSWAAMRLVVSIRIARRRGAFAEQLPDLLQLVAGSLKSGFSLAQGLDAVIREGAQPASGEFARALSLARLGVDQADALQRVADRMDCMDLRWAVMVIRIQREVGGRLAEVLTTTVGTMRKRSHLRNQVRALSAEGRLSAYILVALPVMVGVWMFITDRPYMQLLYTSTIGIVMLFGAVVLIGVGALWMRKVIKVEM